ncbi:MAG TPA: glycoside hydrolase family 3 protein [Gaiellaceae bacterium]|nr:glycoside hydrolase family 3 protein [Gaiellaceae bacterium]
MSADLRRSALACIWPGFPGYEAPDWVLRRLAEGMGGVCLFGWNVRDVEQVAGLTASLQAENPAVLVSTDEEGGDVTRLEVATGSSFPGNWALGAVDDVELTADVAAAIGSLCASAGVNLDLAPVADVNSNPANPVIGIRSFGSEPELVARHVAAFVRGLQRCGVAACAKHFPGHGDTAQDSHHELPRAEGDLEAALVPFRAAIEAGTRAIMTAHIVVPSVENAPATVSRRLLTDLLRGELGFDGVVVTDALEMRGLADSVGVEEGAVRAIEAGADALCLGHDLGDDSVRSVCEAIVSAVGAGHLAEERVVEASERVARLAEWAGRPAPVEVTPGIGLEAAKRALRVEGDVRLVGPASVVELRPAPNMAAGPHEHSLAALLDGGRRDGRLVIVLRDAHRHEWERSEAERLLGEHPDAVVVETGLPLWRPATAGAYLATNGAGRANLEAVAERLRTV